MDSEDQSSLDTNKNKLPPQGYTCKWEGCSEQNIDDLFTHLKICHLNLQTEYKCMWTGCQKYNEANVSKGGVYSHCRTHIPNLTKKESTEKTWTCQICKMEFTSMSIYYRHKKKHSILEKKEENDILRISALSRLLEAHKKDTEELRRNIYEKNMNIKFLNGEILEIIKKYVKGTNIYDGNNTWEQ
ncbi:zinc finger C2H2 domain-containing protein [Vairimorpha necatrix]|uniref:Zinc finger C2H2 domain-containing protein n=1 Tax=Vairimorpha necatrix TaxID=6039 RepID=A0AAX4J9C7_9MICR